MVERDFRIIIPKYDNKERQIKVSALRGYVNEIVNHFGGATVLPSVVGCWKEGNNPSAQCEENFVVDVTARRIADVDLNRDQRWLEGLAKRIGLEMGQAEVFEQQDFEKKTEFVKGKWQAEVPSDLLQGGSAVPGDILSQGISRRIPEP